MNTEFSAFDVAASDGLVANGVATERIVRERLIKMKHRGQANELRTPAAVDAYRDIAPTVTALDNDS